MLMHLKNYLLHNINFLMEAANITAGALSKETGVGQATIYKIKDGMISNPTIDTIYPIAKYFGFSIDELIGVKLYSGISSNGSKNVIPLINFNDIERFPDVPTLRWVNTDFIDIASKCCIEVQVDNWLFRKHSILILSLNAQYETLDFVLVKKKTNNEISIKKLIFDDVFFLQSIVKTLEHQMFNKDDYIILGVVVGYIKYFREPK